MLVVMVSGRDSEREGKNQRRLCVYVNMAPFVGLKRQVWFDQLGSIDVFQCGFDLLRKYPHHSLDIAVQSPFVNLGTRGCTVCLGVDFVV
jgi:hypothetical protein